MTQEEFNNLLRVKISGDKKWYTSPARLVEFLTKDGSSYAIVYNENTKRFQRVSLVDILSVEYPMIESEPKEVEENTEWFVKLFGKDAFSVMDKFKNKYTMRRTENGFEFISNDGKEGFTIQLKEETQEEEESELTPIFPDNVDGKPFYDVASAAKNAISNEPDFQSDESCKEDNLGANMNKHSLNKAIDEGGISGSYESQMKESNKSEEREYYGGC